MPRKAKNLPVKAKEEHFLNLYVRQGAKEEKIADCARQAHLSVPTCKKFLKRKSTQQEIKLRLEPVRTEQARQQIVSESVDAAKEMMQRQLRQQYELAKLYTLDFDVLVGRLMQMGMGLDMNRYPDQIHDVIKTLMVIHGSLQAGNTKKIIHSDDAKENPAALVYTPLFNRLRANQSAPAQPSESTPNDDSDKVYELYPSTKPVVIPDLNVIPPAGESIEESPQPQSSDPNIIVVKVE